MAAVTITLPSLSLDAAHEDDHLCIVCLDEPRTTALDFCGGGHMPVMCAECTVKVLATAKPECPLCGATPA